MSFFILNGRANELADGARTTFTLAKRILDPTRVECYVGNPASALQLVAAPPAFGQFQVIDNQTVELGSAPAVGADPFFNYFTNDSSSANRLVLSQPMTPTANPLVYTVSPAPESTEEFQIVVGRPGTIWEQVASAPSFSQYTFNTQSEVLFGSDPVRGDDPLPRATYFYPRGVSPTTCPDAADPFYSRMRSVAQTLIKKRGRGITFRINDGQSYDVDSGQVSKVWVDIGVHGVILDPKVGQIDTRNIVATDKRILAVIPQAPGLHDKVIIDQREADVVAVMPLKPGCVNVMYEVFARL